MLLVLLKGAVVLGLACLATCVLSLVGLRRTGNRTLKVVAAVTGGCMALAVALLAWRVGGIALAPKAVQQGDGTLVFEGHRYAVDRFDAFPYGQGLEQVAIVEYPSDSTVEDVLNAVLFPSRLYVERDASDRDELWERGLMLELKYTRVD
jgi:hypothetical protein